MTINPLFRLVTCVVFLAGGLAACGGGSSPVTVPASITTVYGHNVTFRNSTSVAWGYNGYGALGTTPNVTANATPVAVTGLPKMDGYAVGAVHSIAFTNHSTVRAWGNNEFGQLGTTTGTLTYSFTPVKVANLSGVTAVSAGGHHSVALKDDGTVWTWGYNAYGQMGDRTYVSGTNGSPKAPAQVAVDMTGAPLTGVTKIAAGGLYTLALQEIKDSGGVTTGTALYGWGDNGHGQLGSTSATLPTSSIAKAIAFPTSQLIVDIAAGASHCLAVTADGKVWAWGYNAIGQLGQGEVSGAALLDRSSPVEVDMSVVAPGKKGVAVAAGLSHSLVLMDDGSVWAWGFNYYGQLGNDTTLSSIAPVTTPVQVKVQKDPASSVEVLILGGPAPTRKIQAVGNSSFAFDGTKAYGWGDNGFGQVGDATTTNRTHGVPVFGFH